MANLKPVLPTLIGRPRDTHRTDRPVRMAQADFSGLERAAGNLVNSAARFSAGLEEIRRKEEDLLFEERKNQYVAEANRMAQEGVFTLKGNALLGAEERLADGLRKLSGKLSDGFSPEKQREWSIMTGRFDNGMVLQAMRYRDQELSKALDEQYAVSLKNNQAAFAASADGTFLENAIDDYTKQYRRTHRSVITNDSLKAFDADVADGDGFVSLPGGRKLKIGTDISMDQIRETRNDLSKKAEEYESGKQTLVDSFVAGLVDTYLNADEPEKAESVMLQYAASEENPVGVSDGVRQRLYAAIDRKMEVRDMTREADSAILRLQTSESGNASEFPLLDPAVIGKAKAVAREMDDGTDKGKRKAKLFLERYELAAEEQQAKFNTAVTTEYKALISADEKGATATVEVLRMKNDPKSKAIVAAWDRHRGEKENSPAFVAKQEQLYAEIQLAVTSGTATVEQDGVKYDLRGKDGKLDFSVLQVFASMMGLSGKRWEALDRYAREFEKGVAITYKDVISAARKAGIKNPEGFLVRYPGLVSIFEEKRNGTVYQNKDKEVYQMLIQFMESLAQDSNTTWDAWNKLTDNERFYFLQRVNTTGSVSLDE